jgi:ABC-type sugar transport system substrate-binding protein
MKIKTFLFAVCLVIASVAGLSACSQKADNAVYTLKPGVVNVVVAGYINHGPMQATVDAVKEVVEKYGDKVQVTWIDKDTAEGSAFLDLHRLTAHMNIIIDGSTSHEVTGKTIYFTWFEGDNWTKNDLDFVISGLVAKLG